MNAELTDYGLRCECGLESRGDWRTNDTGVLMVGCPCGLRWIVEQTPDAVLLEFKRA